MALAESSQHAGKFRRQRSFELYQLPCLGMNEPELLRMQELTPQTPNACAQSWILNRIVAAPSVSLIANNRMLYPRQMNANLMRSSGFQFHLQQRESFKRTPHSIKRQRIATTTYHRHTRAICRIAREWLIDA